MNKEWRGQDYYGRSQLKAAPFNTWVVGGYLFLAGLGGKASMLSAIADVVRPGSETVVRNGRYVPLIVPTLGAALLVWDLHTPQRFYNMFRVAKGTSPMSIGTWILSGFSLFSGASAGLQFLADRRGGKTGMAAMAAHIPAAVFGAGMGTYTSALLAATSTPLWAAAPRALAMRFAAASVASGGASLSLLEEEGPTRRALDAVTAVALASELVIGSAQSRAYRQKGVAGAIAGGHEAGQMLGSALPLGLYALSALRGGGGNLPRVAGLLALGGAFLLRVSTMQAGNRSASDPQISFRFAQPDNLQPDNLEPVRRPRVRGRRRAARRARVTAGSPRSGRPPPSG